MRNFHENGYVACYRDMKITFRKYNKAYLYDIVIDINVAGWFQPQNCVSHQTKVQVGPQQF